MRGTRSILALGVAAGVCLPLGAAAQDDIGEERDVGMGVEERTEMGVEEAVDAGALDEEARFEDEDVDYEEGAFDDDGVLQGEGPLDEGVFKDRPGLGSDVDDGF